MPAPRHHLKQTSAGMVIFTMRLEMVRQFRDPAGQNSYLHFWRASVRFVDPELRNHFAFCFTRQCHSGIDTPRLYS
jgi:hypothetical protein